MKFTHTHIPAASFEDLKIINRVYARAVNWMGTINKDLVEKDLLRNWRSGIRTEDALYATTVKTVIHFGA